MNPIQVSFPTPKTCSIIWKTAEACYDCLPVWRTCWRNPILSLYTICQQGFVSKNIEGSIFEKAIFSSQVQAFPWIFYKILASNFLPNMLASLPNPVILLIQQALCIPPAKRPRLKQTLWMRLLFKVPLKHTWFCYQQISNHLWKQTDLIYYSIWCTDLMSPFKKMKQKNRYFDRSK